MSINCGNSKTLGAHTHETVGEVRECSMGATTNTVTKVDRTAPVEVKRPFKALNRKPFEPQVMKVTYRFFDVRENSTGTHTIKVTLEQELNKRPVICQFTIAGGMLSVLDDMICRFVGFIPSERGPVTLDDYEFFVQSMIGQSFNAYVFEQGILKCTPNSWKPIK